MEEQDAVAVGGPNLSPPDDGFVAQCVDRSPGNPTHVLIGDELAEHVPGCNMAFRKETLEAIGWFDAVHRAAGDDVDVCWKLLVRGERIAFSPGGFVWHHRRSSIRAPCCVNRGATATLRPPEANYYPGDSTSLATWSRSQGGSTMGFTTACGCRACHPYCPLGSTRGGLAACAVQSLYQPRSPGGGSVFAWYRWQLMTAPALRLLLATWSLPWLGLGLLTLFGLMVVLSAGAAATAG